LGRKKGTDPNVSGRADYVCEVKTYGRFVVEVKAPHETIRRDVVEQAHTYAAHPEVSAIYILITNGRSFYVYRTSFFEKPILSIDLNDLDFRFLELSNIICPSALRSHYTKMSIVPGKPLGHNLAPRLIDLRGTVQCGKHEVIDLQSGKPFEGDIDLLIGKVGTIYDGSVERNSNGAIVAKVQFRSSYQQLEDLQRLLGAITMN
jgi:hypothetical protein